MKIRMPGDFTEPIRFFGLVTARDLLRLGLPLLLVGTIAAHVTDLVVQAVVLFPGLVLAFLWVTARPGGAPLEQHLYHRLRWTITRWRR